MREKVDRLKGSLVNLMPDDAPAVQMRLTRAERAALDLQYPSPRGPSQPPVPQPGFVIEGPTGAYDIELAEDTADAVDAEKRYGEARLREQVEEIRARRDAATPGPWRAHIEGEPGHQEHAVRTTDLKWDISDLGTDNGVVGLPEYEREANTLLTAHSWEDIGTLLKALSDARASQQAKDEEIARLKEALGTANMMLNDGRLDALTPQEDTPHDQGRAQSVVSPLPARRSGRRGGTRGHTRRRVSDRVPVSERPDRGGWGLR